jgi:hypothetical protein
MTPTVMPGVLNVYADRDAGCVLVELRTEDVDGMASLSLPQALDATLKLIGAMHRLQEPEMGYDET